MAAAFRREFGARAGCAAAALGARRGERRRGAGLPATRTIAQRQQRAVAEAARESASVRRGHAVGRQGDGDRQRRRHHPDRRRSAAGAAGDRQRRPDSGGRSRPAAPAGAAQPDRRNASRSRPPRPRRSRSRQSDIDQHRRARRRQASSRPPNRWPTYLQTNGSSIKSMRRQIEGEIAWQRLQQRQDRKRRQRRRRRGEGRPRQPQRVQGHRGISRRRNLPVGDRRRPRRRPSPMPTRSSTQLRNGASFAGYARQYSEASTAAVGGDLGWVRPEQLPDAARRRAPRR